MKRWSLCLLAALALRPGARADLIFTATLTGSQSIPPSGSPATAFGVFTLNDAMTALSFDITFSGLEANATVLHFHDAPPGVAGPIVDAVLLPAATSGEVIGTWTSTSPMPLTPALVSQLESGNIYVDIHTTLFPRDPQGELRGQLTLIPEPSGLLLFGLGGFGLVGYGWLRRKRAAV